jgi:hypothetical protein
MMASTSVLIGIGIEMQSLSNSIELIEFLDNCKLAEHRFDVQA